MNYKDTDPYQAGIDAFLTQLYMTPIHALAQSYERFGKEDKFKFAEGFLYAERTLNQL